MRTAIVVPQLRALAAWTVWTAWTCAALAVLLGSRPAAGELVWQDAHSSPGDLGGIASIGIPEGYLFVPKDQMPELNRLTGNLDGPGDVGAMAPEDDDRWLAFFVWDDVGYVSDEDKDELDADAMLAAFQEGDEAANEARAAQGFSRITTEGWQVPPYYDETTQNLTWALRLRSEHGEEIVNHNVRLLGRHGVMEVILVAGPDRIDAAIAEFTPLLAGFDFDAGERYAEYVEGDRLAAYGLTGLIVGGGAALAAKSGLLGLLLKNLKAVFVAAGVAIAGVATALKRRFGRGRPETA